MFLGKRGDYSMNTAQIIDTYYKAVSKREFDIVEKLLHPDVKFIAPLAKLQGKEAVLEATKKFAAMFKTLKIRATFGSKEQAMAVYDLECPAPIGAISSSVLMSFDGSGLISRIELLYDARPFV